MPKSDSWPGGIAMESVTGMDSAGSSDSVASNNTGCSDDSVGHLSAEEKAIMFLEETIDALEVEDDSGLSSDELDRPSHNLAGNNIHHPSVNHNKPEELLAHENPNQVKIRDQRPSQRYPVPTPLLLVSRPVESSPDELDGFRSKFDHQQTGRTVSEGTKPSIGLLSDVADLPPSFIPEPPVKAKLPRDSNLIGHSPPSLDAKSPQKPQKVSSEIPVGLIPPPSDFMDEPAEMSAGPPLPMLVFDGPPDWTPELPNTVPQPGGGCDKPAEMSKSQSVDSNSRGPLNHNEHENLHKKASMKKVPDLTPLKFAQHASADKLMTPSPSSEHVPGVPKEYSETKSPPAVAPKPKKLPSNIIFKSHKDTGATHSLLPQSDRPQLDQQKIRLEALKKLGLLKSAEVNSGPNISSNQSSTFKAKDTTLSSSKPSTYTTAPSVETVQDTKLAESSVLGVAHPKIDMPKLIDTESRQVYLKKHPARPYEVKSASLGRSGVGLRSIAFEPTPQATHPNGTNLERRSGVGHNSIVIDPTSHATKPDKTNVQLSPGQLRKIRGRPLSAGSAKDFSIGRAAEGSNKSLLAASVQPSQPGYDAQKLARSNGISVLITPHGKDGENRREALKKLGLLRD
ncbi:specifically androgen-regulated gene protein-like [Xyrauchen texanus]|uniref:specifically androgen-regulated gene protein-like n=1 Tax=Xyrauchen texanus TaxID=154827 RepID=UPI002241AC90|nr:specifically androgen-regulated gene protein-like [Xyrauchen texanus]